MLSPVAHILLCMLPYTSPDNPARLRGTTKEAAMRAKVGLLGITMGVLFVLSATGCDERSNETPETALAGSELARDEASAEQADGRPPACAAGERCRPPDGPPPQPACAAGCFEEGQALLDRCLAAEGADLEACRNRTREATDACLIERCPPPDGPPPRPACAAGCIEEGQALLDRCLAAEGADVEACRNRAREATDTCLIERCARPDGPPPRPECSAGCIEEGQALLDRCLAAEGADVEACRNRTREATDACLIERCPPPDGPPPRPACAAGCFEEGQALLERCLAAEGADVEACRNRAREATDTCLIERCPPPDGPPPRPACAAGCFEEGQALLDRCLAAEGADLEACRNRTREATDACLIERCPPPDGPPPRPACAAGCFEEGQALLDRCLAAEGADVEACRNRAREATDTCLIERCSPPDGRQPPDREQPPPFGPPDCAIACFERGDRLMHDCMAGDGARSEACMANVQQAVRECLAARCGQI